MPTGKPPVTMAVTNAKIIIAGLLVRIFQGFTPGRGRCPINWFRDRSDRQWIGVQIGTVLHHFLGWRSKKMFFPVADSGTPWTI